MYMNLDTRKIGEKSRFDKSVKEGDSQPALSQDCVKTRQVVINKPVIEGVRVIDNEHAQERK